MARRLCEDRPDIIKELSTFDQRCVDF